MNPAKPVAVAGTPVYGSAVLEVEGLTKLYGSRVAVDDVSFRVGRGEVVGFLGPNGAGKSTTLRMITGFLAPTAGRIRVDGIDAIKSPLEARALIGYMPEGVPLYPEMRVFEYLRYRAELKGIRGKKGIAAAVDRSLDQAAVQDAETRIIGQLSKGYRQRVGLADALLTDPPLLILDEPTSGLDPNQIRSVRALVRGFAKDKTVFLSTHILPEVEAICSRVIIIDRGRMVGEGEPGTLRRGESSVVTFVGLGAVDAFEDVLEGLEVVVDYELEPQGDLLHGHVRVTADTGAEAIFTAVAAAGLSLRELRPGGASLEDVFTSLTAEEDDDEEDQGTDEDDGEPSAAARGGEEQ